jgi:hypothetical protein
MRNVTDPKAETVILKWFVVESGQLGVLDA